VLGSRDCATCDACKGHALRAANRRNHLWGVAHDDFETNGSYASATVLGTGWLTQDECTGTLIRVTTAEVRVHDCVTGASFKLRAPHHRLVRS
jgi:hypothetical protein